MRSLQSDVSVITKAILALGGETEHYAFFYYNSEPVVGTKYSGRPPITDKDVAELRAVSWGYPRE